MATQRYRHMCRVQSIHNFITTIDERHPETADAKRQLLRRAGFGAFLNICKWTKIPSGFVQWVSHNFEPEECQLRLSKFEVLPVKIEDVHHVYDLPMKGKMVTTSDCAEVDITNLLKEFGIKVEAVDRVNVKDLDDIIPKMKQPDTWCKAIIIYILGCLLCPDNVDSVSLRYASILSDLRRVGTYNWSKFVWTHLRKGTQGLKAPKGDMHFLMIHYIQRMGLESPMSLRMCTKPSLRGWDVQKQVRMLDVIGGSCGFGRGITYGYINRPARDADPRELITFDPAVCPIKKAPEYARFLEKQIEAFQTCLNVLTDRMVPNKLADIETERSDDEGTHAETEGGEKEIHSDDEPLSRRLRSKRKNEEPVIAKSSQRTKEQVRKKACEANPKKRGKESKGPECYEEPKKAKATKLFAETEPLQGVSLPTETKKLVEDESMRSLNLDNVVEMACAPQSTTRTPTQSGEKDGNTRHMMDFTPPSFKLLSQSPSLTTELKADEEREEERLQIMIAQDLEFIREHADQFGVAKPDVAQQNLEEGSELVCYGAQPLASHPPVDIVDVADDDEEDTLEDLTVERKVPTPSSYRKSRKRVVKPSMFLTSPYDVHVANSRSADLDKKLVTFIWAPEFECLEPVYQYKRVPKFSICRLELWSLQEGQCVNSIVIENWANQLNMAENEKQRRRIYLTVGSSIKTLADTSRRDRVDHRDPKTAATDFSKKLDEFKANMVRYKMDVTRLEFIFFPALAHDHFVTFVMNLKMGRYEYLNSLDGFTRKKRSGTFSAFEVLGEKLMYEARSFLTELYTAKKMKCPHQWETYKWYDASMPKQPDGLSCGVMTMKFMQEWEGNEKQLQSFKTWSTLSTKQQIEALNQIRIDLCCALVNHKTNELQLGQRSIQRQANDYYEQKQIELLNANAQGDKQKKMAKEVKGKKCATKKK